MSKEERLLLSDAIETAVEAERKNVVLKRLLAAAVAIIACLSIGHVVR